MSDVRLLIPDSCTRHHAFSLFELDSSFFTCIFIHNGLGGKPIPGSRAQHPQQWGTPSRSVSWPLPCLIIRDHHLTACRQNWNRNLLCLRPPTFEILSESERHSHYSVINNKTGVPPRGDRRAIMVYWGKYVVSRLE